MLQIFISAHVNDHEVNFVENIKVNLENQGYFIDASFGIASTEEVIKAIKKSDIYILVISASGLIEFAFRELISLSTLVNSFESKRLIPVFLGDFSQVSMKQEYHKNHPISVYSIGTGDLMTLNSELNVRISAFLKNKIESEAIAEEVSQKIEESASAFIEPTLTDLKDRERSLNRNAVFWYILGFTSLASGVVTAFQYLEKYSIGTHTDWSVTIFFSLKSVVLILLLIATSKYSFTLGKSYMLESLKVSDRIHAISFGKFYLQIFQKNISKEDFKEIFRDWNIITNSNHFSGQNSNDYDPKLLEKAALIFSSWKGKADEKDEPASKKG